MSEGSAGAFPPRRRDEESDWHDLVGHECPHCGCEFFAAEDDPLIVWDPGRAWYDDCRDRACHCHKAPVLGARRSIEGLSDPDLDHSSGENT